MSLLNIHKTQDEWNIYTHLPNDTNWDIDSYKKMYTIYSIEHVLCFLELMNDTFIQNCMIFVMKHDIKPVWEDERNINGSCISFKVYFNTVYKTWKDICLQILSNNVFLKNGENVYDTINGITISPKTNFAILKIWLSNDSIKNPKQIDIKNISYNQCIIKKHK